MIKHSDAPSTPTPLQDHLPIMYPLIPLGQYVRVYINFECIFQQKGMQEGGQNSERKFV